MAARHDPEFSRKLAARGSVGMAIPPEYGGQGRTAVDRFLVTEELLTAGKPIAAHFVADQQTGPTLLHYGTEEPRRFFLPKIAAGECWFSLGMSEPDSGSDLASVRTTATQVEGGRSVNGTKVWTSAAHVNHYFAVLCRTSPVEDGKRHAGLSQLIVDLAAP
ncbi:MAG: acyl-CoA dehydrogenase family protein, partial [Frankiaceae bacterium]|nr:acyl-CoA dehydrogenase family protein [Frankiaceae bacterium]